VDIDELLRQRRPAWEELRRLSSRARRRPRSLRPADVDALVDAYLRTSSDLAAVRTRTDEPALELELTRLVADASAAVYGTSARSTSTVRRFVTRQFPAAVWAMRLQVLVAAAALAVPALVVGVLVATDDRALPTLGSDEQLQQFVERDFVEYYTDQPNPVFAALVGTNNVQVGALAFGAGIAGGLPTLYVLAFNGLNIGVAGGIIHAYDRGAVFWTSILPHGQLELAAIVVSGAAGLHLGWSLLVPGDRRRTVALAEEGQRAAVVLLGLVPAFVLAALIEGFVTPREWPWPVEVGIGALALAVFVGVVLRYGPEALAEERATARTAGGARVVGARAATADVWRRVDRPPAEGDVPREAVTPDPAP
jgi:uncharacterized membrane protein SpoIIM required for sporulation